MPLRASIPPELKKRPFSLEEARRAGVSARMLDGGAWRRIGPSLYCWAGWREDTFQLLEAWHRRLPGAVFIGLTAAWLHRLDVDPKPVHVGVRSASGVRSRRGLLVRNTDLSPGDVTLVRGLPATTLTRTIVDLSRWLPEVEALTILDAALRMGHPRIQGKLGALARPAESPMETRLRWVLLQAGLPAPEVQRDLHDGRGRFIARADLYYPSARLVIEYDGGNHRDRLVEDDRRQNRLTDAGFRVLRFTASDLLARPVSVVALVRAALAGEWA